jgi:hypothetical protein
MLRYFFAMSWVLFATSAATEPSALSGDAIRETFAGASVEVDTPLGVKLPIQYFEDGRLSGEARGLAYLLGAEKDTGKWWVSSSGDRLCHKWSKWFDGVLQCLRLSRDGSRILWRRDDGETGTAAISTPSRLVARAPILPTPSEREQPRSESPSPSLASMTALPRVIPQEATQVEEPFARSSMDLGPILKREPTQVRRTEDKPLPLEPRGELRPAKAPKQPTAIEPSRAPSMRPAQSFRVWGVATYDVLNVRNGPSADYMATGAIPPDALGVRIVGECVAEWCPISHRGMRGWVNSFFLMEDAR